MRSSWIARFVLVGMLALAGGCDDDEDHEDAGFDAGAVHDAGARDAGARDAGGEQDAGPAPDAGADAGSDAGAVDGGDGGAEDAGADGGSST